MPELAGRRAHPFELLRHAHRRHPRLHRRDRPRRARSSRPTPTEPESVTLTAPTRSWSTPRSRLLGRATTRCPAPGATRDAGDEASGATWASGTLNPRYTFDQFVIGASNRFAHAAALSVAESPAPLLQPAVHLRPRRPGQDPPAARDRPPRARRVPQQARPLRLDRDVHERVRRRDPRPRRMPGFKRRYREVDVLLVDDIQFLERTQQLQEEFFHTFNQLHGEGGQIVISSDRPPKSIATPRGPPAHPLRVGPDHRRPAARVRDPPRHPPQEGRVRAPRRHPRRGPGVHRRRTSATTSASSRAR